MLIARAAEAREVLPDALRERGAEVDVVALYETVAEDPDPAALEAAADADYVTFTSSSTVRNLLAAVGDRFPERARVVSIGPVTSETAREAGLEVHVEAERHDPDGLVEALARRRRRAGAERPPMSCPADHLPLRLRLRGRVRRRLPGGDRRGSRPTRRSSTSPTGSAATRCARGRRSLANALPFTPRRASTSRSSTPASARPRRPVAVRVDEEERILVGPDNGLLSPAVEQLGGAVEAVDLALSPFRLEPVSATFHGRDLFAPVAAHLAAGATLSRAGRGDRPRRADGARSYPAPRSGDDRVVAHVVVRRPLRQRGARPRATRTCRETGLRLGRRRLRCEARRDRRSTPSSRARSSDVAAGRADPLRGLVPAAWRWRSTAAAPPTLLAPRRDDEVDAAPGVTDVHRFGRPAPPPARHRLDQRARARALAEAGALAGRSSPPTEQDAGRGRHGRRWSAPAGAALLYSAILRAARRAPALLPLAVPLAVCEAVESLAPVECRVKWPNDVWIEERKVAGVLIEARPPDWAVIGVGLNVAIGRRRVPGRAALAGDLGRPRRDASARRAEALDERSGTGSRPPDERRARRLRASATRCAGGRSAG